MRTARLLLLVTCVTVIGVYSASVATAQTRSNLDCIERSKGQSLKWSSRWATGTEDQDVLYRVKGVRIKNVLPLRRVTLELRALELASKKKRTLMVETEEKARSVCERLINAQAPKFPGELSNVFAEPSTVHDKPFIRYTKDGWVRAKPPRGSARLSICRVHHKEFSCLSEEKTRFGTMLRSVEEEIRWSGQ